MRQEKHLRILLVLILGLSVIRVLYYLQSIVSNYLNATNSPLIPQYIWKYAAFPQFILTIVFIGVGAYCYNSVIKRHYNPLIIWVLFILSIVVIFKGYYVYHFINSFNPYGS